MPGDYDSWKLRGPEDNSPDPTGTQEMEVYRLGEDLPQALRHLAPNPQDEVTLWVEVEVDGNGDEGLATKYWVEGDGASKGGWKKLPAPVELPLSNNEFCEAVDRRIEAMVDRESDDGDRAYDEWRDGQL
jgi:hypothetical protein